MPSATAASLADRLRLRVENLESAVAAVDPARAAHRVDRVTWCANEILSHLSGVDYEFLRSVRSILDEDVPFVDIEPDMTRYTPERAALGTNQLMEGLRRQYLGIADVLTSASEDDLQRRGHIPLLSATPYGDHPTLEEWATAIVDMHVAGHVGQLVQLTRANEEPQ